jgi:hypothetical protein
MRLRSAGLLLLLLLGLLVTAPAAGGCPKGANVGYPRSAAHRLRHPRLARQLLPGRHRALHRRRHGAGADAVAGGAGRGMAHTNSQRVQVRVGDEFAE